MEIPITSLDSYLKTANVLSRIRSYQFFMTEGISIEDQGSLKERADLLLDLHHGRSSISRALLARVSSDHRAPEPSRNHRQTLAEFVIDQHSKCATFAEFKLISIP